MPWLWPPLEPDLGATHPYIGASAGCWEAYGALLATARGEQLVVDTYAAQHPGVEERRSIQSVAVHLMSMCAVIERGASAADAVPLIRRILSGPGDWQWLPHRPPIGSITVVDVLAEQADVPAWSADVWRAWSPHHDTVRAWLDAATA